MTGGSGRCPPDFQLLGGGVVVGLFRPRLPAEAGKCPPLSKHLPLDVVVA